MAVSEMSVEEFKFFWKIENFRFCPLQAPKFLISPTFSVEALCKTTWCMTLYPKIDKKENDTRISCFLCRGTDDGPENIKVISKLFVGSISFEVNHVFKKNSNFGYTEFLLRSIIREIGESFIMECHMRMGDTSSATLNSTEIENFLTSPFLNSNSHPPEILKEVFPEACRNVQEIKKKLYSYPNRCFSCSRFLVEKRFFSCPLQSCIINGCKEKQIIPVVSYTEAPSLVIALHTKNKDDDFLDIDLHLMNAKMGYPIFLFCKIRILDSDEKVIDSVEEDNVFYCLNSNNAWHFESYFQLDDLKQRMNSSGLNKFSLDCEFTFSTGILDSKIQWTDSLDRCFKLPEEAPSGCVSPQILCLYNDKKCFDVVIRTKTKNFDAHKTVLCAMSPVFAAMFSSEMMESKTNIINIDDLDEDTLSKMISFMYTGTLEQWQIESITKLFAAADKYQILTMKKQCRSFLINSLSVENVCSVMSLANVHDDLKLQESALRFVSFHRSAVLRSSEWEIFETKDVQLAIEILKEICLSC